MDAATEYETVLKFSCFDVTLANMKSKAILPIWPVVQQAVESISGKAFTFQDLSVIQAVLSEDFDFKWHLVPSTESEPAEVHLLIVDNCAKQKSVANWHETRVTSFRYVLKNCIHHSLSYLISSIDNVSCLSCVSSSEKLKCLASDPNFVNNLALNIPEKPNLCSFNKTQQEVRNISRLASNQRNSQQAAIIDQLQSITDKHGLEKLKELAKRRGEEQSQNIKSSTKTTLQTIRKGRLLSLPKLCDALRSIAMTEKRSSRPSIELIGKLAPELKLSEDEVRQRLGMVVTHAPEFLSVFPPDALVGVETVKVNLNVPYGLVRNKLEALALALGSSSEDGEDIINDNHRNNTSDNKRSRLK